MTSGSTLPRPQADEHLRRSRRLRRIGLALLAVFVAAGASGQLGVRTTSTTRSSGGWSVTVVHPAVARSGLAVRFEVSVERTGGFAPDAPVRLRLLSSYFDLFDENAFTPQPDTETADGQWTYDEFTAPDGEVLELSVDTRVEPARNTGARGEVQLLDADGEPVVSVPFRTVLVP